MGEETQTYYRSRDMEILQKADIIGTKAYDALTYTKWKDGIDADYPTVELSKIIESATTALELQVEQLEKRACNGLCSENLSAYAQQVEQLQKLLDIAMCPNTACDGKGTIAVQEGDGSWSPEHCQWCHEAGRCCIPAQQQEPTK